MSAISQLKIASHGGISFPYLTCEVTLETRKHVHVYLHTNGGEVEKLGLGLRKFHFTIPAHDTLQPPWRNFYSQVLPQLWALWSSLATAPLDVPSIGRVQAMAIDPKRSIGRASSGETLDVQFLEDSATLATIDAMFKPSVAALPVQLAKVVTQAPAGVPPSLLERLAKAVNEALALAAKGDILARQWAAKIAQVMAIAEAMYQLPVLALPSSVQYLDTFLEMYGTAAKLQKEAQHRSRTVLLSSPTRLRMNVAQVAAWIYGRTDRASELIALNTWDPLNIPPGSIVRHYA